MSKNARFDRLARDRDDLSVYVRDRLFLCGTRYGREQGCGKPGQYLVMCFESNGNYLIKVPSNCGMSTFRYRW